MYEEDSDITDAAKMALSQAVDEHIEKSKDTIDRISELETLIKGWNTEDARQLKSWIKEIKILLQKNFQIQIENFMNINKIPSVRFPEKLRQHYHIVAVDKKGIALYGPEMDKLSQLAKIVEHYKNVLAKKEHVKKLENNQVKASE